VVQCENVVDVYPIAGDPEEVDQMRLAQSYVGTGHIPGDSDDEIKYFAYPHFQVSKAQLEQFCNQPDLLARLAVDTYRADNYWNFFPTDKTIDLIRKALEK
jgi:hypothetical protein